MRLLFTWHSLHLQSFRTLSSFVTELWVILQISEICCHYTEIKQFSFSNLIFLKWNFCWFYKYMLGNISTLEIQDMQHSSLQYYAANFKILFLQNHLFPLFVDGKNTLVHPISCFAAAIFHFPPLLQVDSD